VFLVYVRLVVVASLKFLIAQRVIGLVCTYDPDESYAGGSVATGRISDDGQVRDD
jgi:hypothetical protein